MDNSLGKNIQSVQRAIDIINCFSEDDVMLTLTQISNRLSLNKSTVHGIINTLRNNDYLSQSATGSYMLGRGLLNKVIFSDQSVKAILLDVSRDKMEMLSQAHNVTVCLFMLINEGHVYIDFAASPNAKYRLNNSYSDVPLHSTATGKLVLSTFTPLKLTKYISAQTWAKVSEFTITDEQSLLKEIASIRQQGYSMENQELLEGISAISVPIHWNGKCQGALSVTSTSYHINSINADKIADEIKYFAKQIGSEMDG